MTKTEILKEIKKLPPEELITIIEAALTQIRQDYLQVKQPLSEAERKRQMALAAETLYADYTTDQELTAFTSLDAEDFHA